MIKTHSGNSLFFNQTEYILQVVKIVLVNGKTQSDPLSYLQSVADTAKSSFKSSLLAAELVIGFAQAV